MVERCQVTSRVYESGLKILLPKSLKYTRYDDFFNDDCNGNFYDFSIIFHGKKGL